MMNKERFQELITRPEAIEDDDLVKLQQVVRDYPSFHDAHLLLLYGLYKHNSEKFEDQLSQSSLCLSNRSFFVNAIFNGWTGVPKIETGKVVESITEPIIDAPVSNEILKDNVEIITSNVVEFEVEPLVKSIEAKPEQKVETITGLRNDESFTFSLEDSQPIETFDKKEDESFEKHDFGPDLLELDMGLMKMEDEQSDDLIDHFLKSNPRLVPKLDMEDSRGDISQPGLEESDEIVTETLADILEQQGHFLKSIEAFRKLILKFPEKSTYFASRIKELEKRIK